MSSDIVAPSWSSDNELQLVAARARARHSHYTSRNALRAARRVNGPSLTQFTVPRAATARAGKSKTKMLLRAPGTRHDTCQTHETPAHACSEVFERVPTAENRVRSDLHGGAHAHVRDNTGPTTAHGTAPLRCPGTGRSCSCPPPPSLCNGQPFPPPPHTHTHTQAHAPTRPRLTSG